MSKKDRRRKKHRVADFSDLMKERYGQGLSKKEKKLFYRKTKGPLW
jgi:hypothetical protein